MSDISKDLKDQPKFQEDIGSKGQDHHTFEIEKQNTLKKIQNFQQFFRCRFLAQTRQTGRQQVGPRLYIKIII